MINDSILTSAIKNIIEKQQSIIGPLAIEQASKITGIRIDAKDKLNVVIKENDSKKLLTDLVRKYEELFGQASIEVCKDALKEISPQIPADELPEILR